MPAATDTVTTRRNSFVNELPFGIEKPAVFRSPCFEMRFRYAATDEVYHAISVRDVRHARESLQRLQRNLMFIGWQFDFLICDIATSRHLLNDIRLLRRDSRLDQ